MVKSFPKIKSPYVREEIDGQRVVTPTVQDGYEWVFERAEEVDAVEKIDGENVGIRFNEETEPVSVHKRSGINHEESQNRGERVYHMEEVPMWNSVDGSIYVEGIANAYRKEWIQRFIDGPGLFFGELVGPKVQDNRYDLDRHYWVPFEYARENLVVESYGKYNVSFESLREWIVGNDNIHLIPLFYSKMHGGLEYSKAYDRSKPEGLVFMHPEPESTDGPTMAKIRRDMYPEVSGKHDR